MKASAAKNCDRIPSLQNYEASASNFNTSVVQCNSLISHDSISTQVVSVSDEHSYFSSPIKSPKRLLKRPIAYSPEVIKPKKVKRKAAVQYTKTPPVEKQTKELLASNRNKKFSHSVKSPPEIARQTREKLAQSVYSSVRHGNVYSAFRKLASHNKSAQASLLKVVSYIIHHEIKDYKANTKLKDTHTLDSIDALGDVTLATIREEHKKNLPVTTTIFESTFPNKPVNENKSDIETARKVLQIALPLYSHSDKKFKFLQQVFAVNLWRGGCNEKLYKVLNRFGITQCVDTARNKVLELCQNCDKKMDLWCAALNQFEVN